jgi:hypothetical protein
MCETAYIDGGDERFFKRTHGLIGWGFLLGMPCSRSDQTLRQPDADLCDLAPSSPSVTGWPRCPAIAAREPGPLQTQRPDGKPSSLMRVSCCDLFRRR